MRDEAARLARALEWIARLPLCGEPELARLLGVDEHDARRLIHLLSKQGWAETVEGGSPELELRRLAVVRDAAVPALADALGSDPGAIAGVVPVRFRDVLERVTRLEITVGVNRLFADVAADLRRSGVAELTDARSLPLALPAAERWWLPRIQGYGCLRAGQLHAPFLLAWDRTAAPDLQRRRRLAGWLSASIAVERRWGPEGLPPILVICPSARERRWWEQALADRAEIAESRFDVLLSTGEELRAHGVRGAGWWRPGYTQAPLVELLGWGYATAVDAVRVEGVLDDFRPPARRTGTSLRERALARATAHEAGPVWQHLGSLGLATGPAEKTLIEWVARHPLVSAAELAALLNDSEGLIQRRLEWLTRFGAVQTEAAVNG